MLTNVAESVAAGAAAAAAAGGVVVDEDMFAELPPEMHVLTLNCWGLWLLSKWRSERLAEIGRRLATSSPPPGIVALQEVWCESDYESIRHETRAVLPYGKFFHSGFVGSGLAILSRWPIEEVSFFAFPLSGRPSAVHRGDWYAGKGVACAWIRYGPRRRHVAEVFNVHTHAHYESAEEDSYACHRAAQAWFLAKLLRGAAERGHLVLAMGDLNCPPRSLPHRLLTSLAPVRDAWRALHPNSSLGSALRDTAERERRVPVPTCSFSLLENGATFHSAWNTWSWGRVPAGGGSQKGSSAGKGKVLTRSPPGSRKRGARAWNRASSLVEVKDLRGQRAMPPSSADAARSWEEEVEDGGGSFQEDDGDAPDETGRRIDYVFAGTGSLAALGGSWAVKAARVGMVERHADLGCSLSDHFSVEVTLEFRRQGGNMDLSDTGSNVAATRTGTGTAGSGARRAASLTVSAAAAARRMEKGSRSRLRRDGSDAEKEKYHDDNDTIDGATVMMNNGTYLQSPAPSVIDAGLFDEDDAEEDEQQQHQQQHQHQQSLRARPTSTVSAGGTAAGVGVALTTDSLRAADFPRAIDFLPSGGVGGVGPVGVGGGVDDEGGPLPGSAYDEVLALTRRYVQREKRQRLWRGLHFLAGVLVWIGCVAASWFSPTNYASLVFTLVGGVLLVSGVVDGLIALLFMGSELAGLREFEWEIRHAKAAAVASGGTW